MNSFWAAFYRDDAILSGLEQADTEQIVGWMNGVGPWEGGKVDWARLPGDHRHWPAGDDEARMDAVLSELSKLLGTSGDVLHIGDSLSPYDVRFGMVDFRRVVPSLLAIPEHHYFVAEDRLWLLAFTMEGDVDLHHFR